MTSASATPRTSLPRHPEVLVAPCVTFAFVLVLLVAARFYDSLPAKPPECGFRSLTGIPCLSCGGTRSMKALSRGHLADAARFNPAVVVGVACSAAWLLLGWLRFRRGDAPPANAIRNRRTRWVAAIVAILLTANWIYLVCCLE